MDTITRSSHATHAAAGGGPHHLMLGTVVVSKLLDSGATDGRLALVELEGLPGSGPGPHLDPWNETFYVLHGELTFQVEENGTVREIVARTGDAVFIPEGIGHAFSVTGTETARYLIVGAPAGIERFFADAGEEIETPTVPAGSPPAFDRERLLAAFGKHRLTPYAFPGD